LGWANQQGLTLIKPKKKLYGILIDVMWLKSKPSLNGVDLNLTLVPCGLSLGLI
jgi:hypothetical protein